MISCYITQGEVVKIEQKPNLWWGYLHREGAVHVRRYVNNSEIIEAEKSPFVSKVTPLIETNSRIEAKKIATEMFTME